MSRGASKTLPHRTARVKLHFCTAQKPLEESRKSDIPRYLSNQPSVVVPVSFKVVSLAREHYYIGTTLTQLPLKLSPQTVYNPIARTATGLPELF